MAKPILFPWIPSQSLSSPSKRCATVGPSTQSEGESRQRCLHRMGDVATDHGCYALCLRPVYPSSRHPLARPVKLLSQPSGLAMYRSTPIRKLLYCLIVLLIAAVPAAAQAPSAETEKTRIERL